MELQSTDLFRPSLGTYYVQQADSFTRVMWIVVKACTSALIVLLPLAWVIQFFGVVMKWVTFGLYLLLYSLIWMPFFGLLMGTSWLWIRFQYLRPILAIPGLVLAITGDLVLMCAPPATTPNDTNDRLLQASLAEEWPLSWMIWRTVMENDDGNPRQH